MASATQSSMLASHGQKEVRVLLVDGLPGIRPRSLGYRRRRSRRAQILTAHDRLVASPRRLDRLRLRRTVALTFPQAG